MNKQETASKSTTRKLLGVLSLAAALTAFSPLATRAESDQTGSNNAHQERNPSQHPELFTVDARGSQLAPVPEEVRTVRRTPRRHRNKAEGRAAVFAVTPATAEGVETPGDVIGTGAPHQERNPSAHPELFVPGAQR